jgi:competence ComEA-like helix-hairpin-helix protein
VPIRGSGGSSHRKRRGLLALSLILLVWNLFASAERSLSVAFSPPPDGFRPFAVSQPLSYGETVPSSAETPRSGPLTIRQKYLLGKRVDINKASVQEISELPGVSDETAAAVVAERDRNGRFRSPDDLLVVRGIKAKRLQKILPFLSEMPNN